MCEIINTAKNIPEYHTEDMTFYTGEVKYFIDPKMNKFLYTFYSEENYLDLFSVVFSYHEVQEEDVLLKVEGKTSGLKRIKQSIDENRGE